MEKFITSIPDQPLFRWEDAVYAGTYTKMTEGSLTGNYRQVCDCGFDFEDMEEREAYAKLFAASPLLLSALIEAIEDLDEQNMGFTASDVEYHMPDWYAKAKAALAAAGVTVKTVEDDHA